MGSEHDGQHRNNSREHVADPGPSPYDVLDHPPNGWALWLVARDAPDALPRRLVEPQPWMQKRTHAGRLTWQRCSVGTTARGGCCGSRRAVEETAILLTFSFHHY